MTARAPTRLLFLLLALLPACGCRHQSGPAVPALERRTENNGLLLRTGAIQLGPGVANNSAGWISDSRGGLLSPD